MSRNFINKWHKSNPGLAFALSLSTSGVAALFLGFIIKDSVVENASAQNNSGPTIHQQNNSGPSIGISTGEINIYSSDPSGATERTIAKIKVLKDIMVLFFTLLIVKVVE